MAAGPTRTAGGRLSREAWLAGALGLLTSEGIAAVTINRLCAHLGVTRGSFYWHFADLDALREAVAARWIEETRRVLGSLDELEHLPARERLRVMTRRLVDPASRDVERALRGWAREEDQVAAVIAEGDAYVLGLVEGAFLELGREPADARVLAGLLVYAGIGFAHGEAGIPTPTAAEVDRLVDLVGGGADPVRTAGPGPASTTDPPAPRRPAPGSG